MKSKITPSQTIGPYFAYGLTARQYNYDFSQIATGDVATEEVQGERIRIVGNVFDAEGKVVNDSMIESLQADSLGVYRNEILKDGFTGFGRFGTGTDPQNRFIFNTIKPGSSENSAPHIKITVFGRGISNHLYTHIYFEDEDNSNDEILNLVPEELRLRLNAKKSTNGYLFNIYLQGDKETPFFDF